MSKLRVLIVAFGLVWGADSWANGAELIKQALRAEENARQTDEKGDYERAIALYGRVLSAPELSTPQRTQALIGRGSLYAEIGDCVSAISDYDEALTNPAKSARPYLLRAACLRERGKLDLALRDYDDAVMRSPKEGVVRLERGAVHLKLQHYAEAIGDLDMAAKLLGKRESSDLHLMRGDAHFGLQDYEKAATEYHRALAITRRNTKRLLPQGINGQGESLRPIYSRLRDTYAALANSRSGSK